MKTKMTRQEIHDRYRKALDGGKKMLEDAKRYDALANENQDETQAALQRMMANELRCYYKRMFN